MTTELYKRHRPKALRAIVGNRNTVAALENMVEKGTLPRTILLHGPSGCGKTTIGRILKKCLGCHDMDFHEKNCSDVRGVDSIREIYRMMHLAPVGGNCRIWLLDEVHQWTRDSQHAALKMLEDTPDHVYFFLCTTDPQKLLKTILTRCCEMPVRLLTYDELTKLVKRVCKREDAEISDDTLEEIVSSAQGSARTALVLLDKVLNLKEEERANAIRQRLAEENEAIDLCRALIKKASWSKVSGILKNLKSDPEKTRWAVMRYARTVLLSKNDPQAYAVICAFENNFYDSKEVGLIRACFETVFSS